MLKLSKALSNKTYNKKATTTKKLKFKKLKS